MVKEIGKAYNNWLKEHADPATKKAYVRTLKNFLNIMFDKEVIDLTEDDFSSEKFSPTTVMNRFVLSRRNDDAVKDSSIRRDFNVVLSFVDQLERDNVFGNVDYLYLKNDCLNLNLLNDDSTHYDALPDGTFVDLIRFTEEYRFNSSDILTNERYIALIEFLYRTATSISTTFNLRWSNMKVTPRHDGNIYIDDSSSASGKVIIPDDLFDEVYRLFFHGNNSDKIFGDTTRVQLSGLLSDFSSVSDLNVSMVSLIKEGPHYLRSETPSYMNFSAGNFDISDVPAETIIRILEESPALSFRFRCMAKMS